MLTYIIDHLNTSNISNLTLLMATSVLKVLNNITPGFSIKWPNDIYYQDKKAFERKDKMQESAKRGVGR